ncbi:hypothetical protein Y032_0128g1461 [Ancylostoma ceylanicum]|uniref:Uncharacterized protein n=1 Tax=Ancylostoma ceylanicum TaxID=53326 RepID=A0A016T842_9BILA|nr:hypothetical protein Y032_0128g1461 [Ancylostoma ceylanicum]
MCVRPSISKKDSSKGIVPAHRCRQAIRGKVDEFFERKWAGRVRVTRLKSLVFETGDGEGTKICISFLRKKPHPLRVNGKSRTSVVGIRDVIREISNLVNPSIRYVRPKTAVTR